MENCSGIVHYIKSGETFTSIAKLYNIPLNEIIDANPQITNPYNIKLNDPICIPGPICNDNIKHIVEKDESLEVIANFYKVSAQDILNVNPQIADSQKLEEGQGICIPVPFANSNNVPGDYSESKQSSNTPITTIDNSQIKKTNSMPDITNKNNKISLSYLFGADSKAYLERVNAANGNLNIVMPDFFEIEPNGDLKIAPEYKLNQEFVDEMHRRGIKVVPYISNNWDRNLGNIALDNRENLAEQIKNAIEKYNLDGVNVDIENVYDNYKDRYTDFVRILREKIPSDKEVSVAVAANPNGWKTGWHGSYDYPQLAKFADYLMIMNYDESYNGGPQGPISSKQFFDDSIDYALNQGVPKEKIVSGIPFFGRYWKEGEGIGGYGISNKEITKLIGNYESDVDYNDDLKSTLATVIIRDSDIPPVISGKTLTPGRYYIWFDDDDSIKYKLNTIREKDLKGVGSWALGQENPSTWDYYAQALGLNTENNTGMQNNSNLVNLSSNSNDIKNKIIDNNSTAMMNLANISSKKILNHHNNHPKPNSPNLQIPDTGIMSKPELQKPDTGTISKPKPQTPDTGIMNKPELQKPDTGTISKPKPQTPDTGIIDKSVHALPSKNKKFYIEKLIKTLETAKDPSSLNENKILTRGEVAAALAILADYKSNSNDLFFNDISNYWARGYVNSLFKNGIIAPTDDKKFMPDQIATKKFVASVVNRIFKLPPLNGLPNLSFTDLDKNDSSYKDIKRLYYLNLIKPKNLNNFGSNQGVNINELAGILEAASKYKYKFKT